MTQYLLSIKCAWFDIVVRKTALQQRLPFYAMKGRCWNFLFVFFGSFLIAASRFVVMSCFLIGSRNGTDWPVIRRSKLIKNCLNSNETCCSRTVVVVHSCGQCHFFFKNNIAFDFKMSVWITGSRSANKLWCHSWYSRFPIFGLLFIESCLFDGSRHTSSGSQTIYVPEPYSNAEWKRTIALGRIINETASQ